MPQVELAGGTVEYQDTGGDGPVLVFLPGLTDVTLVQNDWGGAQILIAEGDTTRVARLAITSCEAFGNYPPRPARAMVLAARIPGGLAAMMRLRAVRRAPGSWGWMSKRPVPDEVTEDRMMPLRHGRRLADLFPDARLTEIDDSYTLLPEDQPEQLIRAIRGFVPAACRNTPLPNNDPIGPALRADRGR